MLDLILSKSTNIIPILHPERFYIRKSPDDESRIRWDRIKNLKNMDNDLIEKIINMCVDSDDYVRFCKKLIVNSCQFYLIKMCVDSLELESDLFKILKFSAERNFYDSKIYNLYPNDPIENNYITALIRVLIKQKQDCLIKLMFKKLRNNQYKYYSLIDIFHYKKVLSLGLFDNGNCMTSEKHIEKFIEFLSDEWECQPKNDEFLETILLKKWPATHKRVTEALKKLDKS